MISLAGLSRWISNHVLGDGTVGVVWGYWLSAIGLLLTSFYLKKDDRRFFLTPYFILLFSPQTLFYDFGLAVFFFMAKLKPSCGKDFLILAALWIGCSLAISWRSELDFPIFILPFLALVWMTLHSKTI